ncbi:hypothetical protein VN97_g7327 [Penicillium thymicola]|uniref:Uncharacterized protein n=1 Tax=Penicillium thymicola TaxID=293382 RepID=A0AAI9TEZ0_PENTH|nr:hypothetical protein VN97_g7327 [Penicillium thymicola]
MTLLQLPNKSQRKGNSPLLIIPLHPSRLSSRAYRPLFSLRPLFNIPPPYRGQLCALPHTCLCRYLIGFLTKSTSESVLISAIGLIAF